MNDFIEQNRRFLAFYGRAAQIGGWIFLVIALAAVAGHSVALLSRVGQAAEFERYWGHDVPWGMVTTVLPTGLLALGIAQLIRYLLSDTQRPGWMLCNAHRLLYAYAALVIVYYVWAGAADVRAHFGQPYDFPLRMILLLLFVSVKVLALVGVAEIARRLLPVIEEHKSLV